MSQKRVHSLCALTINRYQAINANHTPSFQNRWKYCTTIKGMWMVEANSKHIIRRKKQPHFAGA